MITPTIVSAQNLLGSNAAIQQVVNQLQASVEVEFEDIVETTGSVDSKSVGNSEHTLHVVITAVEFAIDENGTGK